MKIATGARIAAILSGVLFCSAAATANEIDLSAWTCKQFQSATEQEIALILVWLDGYYQGDEDSPVIDTAQLGENRAKLEAYCKSHPDTALITAADALFERE
jgi:acid stress chaperone HdeB